MLFVINHGAWLLSQEKIVLDRVLKNKRGNDLLQIGVRGDFHLIESARFTRTFVLDNGSSVQHDKPFIQASADCLPIQSESMDIILLMHQLEAVRNPMDVLQEAYRVLRPNGQLIIFGFHKWGVWNLLHHHEKYYSAGKIKRFLRALDFEITEYQTLCYWPPFLFFETLGQFCLPYAGSVYMLAATKNILGMTPLISNHYGRVAKLMEVGAQATTK